MAKFSIPDLNKLNIELFPDIINRLGRESPERVFCAVPRGSEVSDGFRDVTFRMFANATSRAAWFIEQSFGTSTTCETICYLGPSDLRYCILVIAAAKAGYKALFSSPRNSHEGHLHLLRATQCKYFLTPAEVPPGVQRIIDDLQIRHIIVPEEAVLMDPTLVPEYHMSKSYEDAMSDPFLVLHTSGTSGLPKPIPKPYGAASVLDVLNHVPYDEFGNPTVWQYMKDIGGRLFNPVPMFHGGGLFLSLVLPLYLGVVPVLAPVKPLTPELVDEVHRSGAVTATFLPPSLVEAMTNVPEYMDNLSKMKYLFSSSAPLPSHVADIVKRRTRVLNMYSQTEVGLLHLLLPDNDDAEYVRIGPCSGVEFRHYEDDMYEFVVVKDKRWRRAQGAFLWQPNITEYSTHDLFSKHPDPAKSDHWLYRGRLDDVIVFANGEKINPITMESVIETHPRVSSAMVVGAGREQAALLVQPQGEYPSNEEEITAFINTIWPKIEEANKDIPHHGILVRELILLTKPDQPIQKTPKGSIKRQATYKGYAAEFDALYKKADDTTTEDSVAIDLNASDDVLDSQLLDLVIKTTLITPTDENDDFFKAGMDSLQVLQLSRRLRSSLRNDPAAVKRVLPSLVYANSSIAKLRKAIKSSSSSQSRSEMIESMLAKHVAQLPSPSLSKHAGRCFIVTGSTGRLGSYLLGSLLVDPTVDHIYCLNRSADAGTRQEKLHESQGLASPANASRVTFLHGDFSKPDLGVGHVVYTQLLRTVTHIVHNAWTVDWKLPLESFSTTNIAGVRHLIELASLSKRNAKLAFVSTIGTVSRWAEIEPTSPVPERIVDDIAAVGVMGYAESKSVAERLLDTARKTLGVQTSIFRPGQIAGAVLSTKGLWNTSECLPRLIRSSNYLVLVPKDLGNFTRIDWIPVDILANTILELIDAPTLGDDTPVYNLINSTPTTWGELVPIIEDCLAESGTKVKVVEFAKWVQALRKTVASTRTQEDVAKNPAVQLADFFEGLSKTTDSKNPKFSTTKTYKGSKSLRECGPFRPEWLRLYMSQWGYVSEVPMNGKVNGITHGHV